jgi:phosphoribosylformylglycinamidine cyclo-ligase
MYNTFNMGIGMCAIVAPEDAETALAVLSANGIHASVIGAMIRGNHDVEFAEEH